MPSVTFIFHDYLREMLKKKHRSEYSLQYDSVRKASIKDVIESLGIPHPIIGKLTVNGREIDFNYILQHRDIVEASPLTAPANPFIPTTLRPETLDRISFVVDVNVGKLALFLRMLGFDTVYDIGFRHGKLADIAASEKRILLTRDTSLLKRKIVIHGYLLREQNPMGQLIEVIHLYDLGSMIKPLSRCIPCNGRLVPVDKETVLERLEPLTRKYYESFHLCEQCNRIYWPGSHQEQIVLFVRRVLKAVNQDALSGD
ncbi:MAG: twitching motility protein PilT [Deltaproteobacteria bacterium]|jgi:uncharacterized protein with PIN domain|nr:twitching motility protein PilT [Deltaproteobacteria bacterium]